MAKVNPVQMQKYLKDMDYPAGKEDIIQHAQQHGADKEARSVLENLPDRQYQSAVDVSKGLGEVES